TPWIDHTFYFQERGGQKGVSVDRRGKRRVKNRDAARKSRKKQTERADILHQVSLAPLSLTQISLLYIYPLFLSCSLFSLNSLFLCLLCFLSHFLTFLVYFQFLSFILNSLSLSFLFQLKVFLCMGNICLHCQSK
uniref:BZIP domain-containing protein n=1 Tax=Salmo trutta TaxID=8032 RepID=A0A673X282_SALTR